MDHTRNTRRLSVLAMTCVIGTAVLLPVSNASASNWGANVEKGSDIIMSDLRWPTWDKGTYYCFWYTSFVPNGYTTFYGGVAVWGPNTIPGMFTSYWGRTKTIHEGEHCLSCQRWLRISLL